MIEIASLRAFQGLKKIFYLERLNIPSKGLFLIEGDNGSGKSTLIRCILNIHTSYSGDILLDGIPISSFSRREIASRIAYLPQLYRSDAVIPVRDYIFQGAYSTVKSRHKQLIRELNLEGWLNMNFSDLSGGEQQLVRIARVLGSSADYYFLDEPDSFLSRKNRNLFLRVVHEIGKQASVVMVSHREEVGEGFCSLIKWYED